MTTDMLTETIHCDECGSDRDEVRALAEVYGIDVDAAICCEIVL